MYGECRESGKGERAGGGVVQRLDAERKKESELGPLDLASLTAHSDSDCNAIILQHVRRNP